MLAWVESYLLSRGWRIERLEWADENGIAKANLLAFAGPPIRDRSVPIDLAFVCHTDTVPYAASWMNALTLEEHDGHLHGCGSCDVKGALAAFLTAVGDADGAALSQRVALLLTADEEIGCKGAERLLASESYKDLRIRSAIISEPTSLRPGVAGKGYGLARITVHGREAHSAFPAQGRSAITVAARLITEIDKAFGDQSVPSGNQQRRLFDPPRTTVNIGVLHGGTAKNIVAGECGFLVEWRALPGEPGGAVLARLQELSSGAKTDGLSIEIELLRDEQGFAPADTGLLQQRLHGMLNALPMGISFGSEASRMTRVADEVIVIGPGDMRTAHSDRECVPIAELEQWTRVLRVLMQIPD